MFRDSFEVRGSRFEVRVSSFGGFGGLDGGEGLGELSLEFLEHEFGGADVVFGCSEFADRRERAVDRVCDDFFDGLRGLGGVGRLRLAICRP